MPRVRQTAILIAIAACLALSFASTLRAIGPSNVFPRDREAELRPIAFDDYPLQFYYGRLGGRFLAEGGVTYGYDPNFLAGYVKTPFYYPSSKPFELSFRLFPESNPALVFNRTIFLLLAACPWLMLGAAVSFRMPPAERLVVVALSGLPHFAVPTAGFYPILEAAGMVPYIFASFLSVFVVSLVHRYLADGEKRAALALLVAAPALYFTHLTAMLLTAVPIAAIYLSCLRRLPLRRHAWMWFVLGAIAVLNWPWIKGYLLFSHYADFGDFYTPGGVAQFAPGGGWLAPFEVAIPTPKLVSLVPPLFGVAGLALWWREGRRRELWTFLPQLSFLFIVAYYGIHLGLAAVAPGRITLPLGLYLFFPAAHGLIAAIAGVRRWIDRATTPSRARALQLSLVAGGVAAASLSDLPERIWRPFSLPELERREGYSAHGERLLDWLREQTDPRGRILHEETDRKAHRYYGTHLPAWIPLQTGRQLASGPAPHALLKHNFLRFIAGSFRGEAIHTLDSERIASYLSLYNVRWVLCWSRFAKIAFNRFPAAARVGNYEKFTLYRIDSEPSYFLRGRGRIEVRDGRLWLSDVVPEEGAVAIKYHWLESLRTDPPRRIEPISMLDDPIPFISVLDPPSSFAIYNDFGLGLSGQE